MNAETEQQKATSTSPSRWISTADALPELGVKVIAIDDDDVELLRIIVAQRIEYAESETRGKFFENDEFDFDSEFDTNKGIWYIRNGWYYLSYDGEDTKWRRLSPIKVTHWQPIDMPVKSDQEGSNV